MGANLPPQAVVIFGASGDLTKRKLLPAFYSLFLQGLLPKGFAIVGYSRTTLSDDDFRAIAHDGVKEYGEHAPHGEVWRDFAAHLSYLPGEFSDPGSMNHVIGHLEGIDREQGTEGRRFFYAATPPVAYPDVVRRVAETGMHRDAKIVFEKPFGRDLRSARELNAAIHEVFDESQVFRIDHYLGKETVQNVLALRFSNGLFEPVWNRRYIDHIQITVAEDIGIEGRGAFYEETGAIRDMIATHLFQVMTFVTMEPPVSFEPDRLRDETVKVLRSTMACDPAKVVRGQYRGYRGEPDVADDSTVETFAALELEVDNWRWSGVPVYLRTGKELAAKCSEVTLTFRKVPYNVFRGAEVDIPPRDHLTIRIQPNEGVTMAVNAKTPGPGLDLGRATIDFDYEEEFGGRIADAYELLLLEAMEGDRTLFLRQDDVERSWAILDPILTDPSPVQRYEPGTWGPPAADALIHPRRWHVTRAHRR
ncbi:MAG TPA: glucose-6-phosphate dehydrogenase [Actinomycetota bacterium]|nr:glucose-6-phosphate dehydrogenase [Actinomycetota bacterium]